MTNNPTQSPIKPYQQIIASGSGAVLTALFMTLAINNGRSTSSNLLHQNNRRVLRKTDIKNIVHYASLIPFLLYIKRTIIFRMRGYVLGLFVMSLIVPKVLYEVRLQSQTSHSVRHSSINIPQLPTKLIPSTTPCRHYMTHQHIIRYSGTLDALSKIVRSEGLHVLWSGLTPTLCVSIPTVIIYFTSYMKAKQLLGYDERSPNPILPVIAGAGSRIFAVTTVSPFELIRTKMQSEKVPYAKLLRLIRTSLIEEGPRVLWKGLLPTLWRDIPFSMIYWFNYETFRAYLVQSNMVVDMYATFFCGALAGAIAAILTTPADVVKTFRQIELGQSKYPSTKACIKCLSTVNTQPIQSTKTLSILLHILQIEGPKGLFTGLVPRLLKVAPACAIMITSFETIKSCFQRLNAGSD